MLNSAKKTIGDTKQAMLTCMMRMHLQYANIYVKATPEQMLDLAFEMGSSTFAIEDLGNLIVADDYTFHVIPHSNGMVPITAEAFAKEKPLFKQEIIDNPYIAGIDTEGIPNADRMVKKIVAVGMPDVTKEMYDIYVKAIDFIHDETKTQIEAYHTKAVAQLNVQLAPFPDDLKNELKDELKKTYDMVSEKVEQLYSDKKADTDEAYYYYQTNGIRPLYKEAAKMDNDSAAARGANTGEFYKSNGANPHTANQQNNDGSTLSFDNPY